MIGDAPNEVLVKDLSVRQIALLGFKAPTLAEGMYTNKEVILRRAEGAVLERAHVLESWLGPSGLQMYGVRFAVDDHLDCFLTLSLQRFSRMATVAMRAEALSLALLLGPVG